MATHLLRRLTGGALALSAVLAVQATYAAPPAHAATTFDVTTTVDIGPVTGACGNPTILTPPNPGSLSLREAVCLANNNGGVSTVRIPAGLYALTSGSLFVGVSPGQDVSLRGAGAGLTTISAGGNSQVLTFDLNLVGGITGLVAGVTITGGADSTTGGAGIIAGSGNASTPDSLTIQSSTISGNNANGSDANATDQPGGGIQFIGGSLSVRNSVVSNNTSKSSPGSGIAYLATGATAGEAFSMSGSTVTGNTTTNGNGTNVANGGALYLRGPAATAYQVTGSTFSDNTSTATTGSARGAAIRVENGALSVLRSTFTGNGVSGGADSGGGAVDVTTGAAVLTFNRFAGNAAPSGSAVRVGPGAGAVNLARNWWGCSQGPNAPGCQSVASLAPATLAPYLVLTGDASPATVLGPNAASTITARLTRDSAGGAVAANNLTAFEGLPIVWSDVQPAPATVAAPSSPITGGVATVGYSSQSAVGPGQVLAALDGATTRIAIQVNQPPGAPAITNTVPDPGSVTVVFDPPASTGGQPITAYEVQCTSPDGGAPGTASGATSPITVSGLSGLKSYQCQVRATSSAATGPFSTPGATVVVPAPTAPGKPTVESTSSSSGAVTVAFVPGATGGSPITSFSVSCVSSDGGVNGTATGPASPVTVTGLSGGKSYRCRVRATNAVGTGDFSGPGAVVVVPPATVPPSPTVTSSTASAGAVTVAFTPSATGGSPVTSYQAQCVSSDGGTTGTATGAASPLTVTVLTGGKSYKCRARATNAVGTGGYSPYGPPVVLPPATVPQRPVVDSTTPAAGSATVAFTPKSDGGSPITGFTAQCTSSDGGVTGTKVGTASPLTVTGLSGGKTYRCRVSATNAIGTSTPSVNGTTVVLPAPTAPGRPAVTGSTPGAGSMTVAFSPPASDGGGTVTSYDVQCTSTDGGTSGVKSGATSPLTVTGLSSGKSYRCRVRAVNVAGPGDYSPYGATLVVS